MAQDHALHLGKLLGNLQSLETMLRAYLVATSEPRDTRVIDYWDLAVGDIVDENAFTGWDSLGVLVDRFNRHVSAGGKEAVLARDALVRVRDLIAHGRVSAPQADPSRLRIVKFGPPSAGSVEVVDAALMDEAWFTSSIDMTRSALAKVHAAYEQLAA